ncbi:MAG: Glu-tRNA(Gln) amidotransferase subunit GatE [Candidatus Neomarinimicrobiota bacterium]
MLDFTFRPFNEMTPADYAKVGFKGGLEIHQQLLTEKKLFCRCPAGKYSSEYDAEILRHMRPTLSELGEYDGTALMEFKTRKDIIYNIRHETVCTYEMDDTPPFELNEQALDIALEIGLLYRSNIVDEIHIARKQYLDGSIPTGFQRTAIISVGGELQFKDRKIGITQLAIEEDACREVSDIGHTRTYLTDRLGMPLIETVTDPDMRTPQELAEVGNIFRYLTRSTGKVRTGYGAARQDVNVSVDGGTRIEIKGVSRIRAIPLLAFNEAQRQWNLLRIREELWQRGITGKSFQSVVEDLTRVLRRTQFVPIKNALAQDVVIKGVLLRGFRGILRRPTQTDTTFSQEIADRVRVVACLTSLPNIIHSDSPSETLTTAEWQRLKKNLRAREEDTVVVVWGSPQDAQTGAEEIVIRAREATVGIPSETRQAHADGTNGFERILPGPNRMYPDTDLPPKRISPERLGQIADGLNENYWERVLRYRRLQLPDDVVSPLALSAYFPLFDEILAAGRIEPRLAALALVQFPKRIARSGLDITQLTPALLRDIFRLLAEGRIVKDGLLTVMLQTCLRGRPALDELPSPCATAELDQVIAVARSETDSLELDNDEQRELVLMGIIMNRLRGRVNGAEVRQRLATSGRTGNNG